jgi:hypothetical protein
MAAWVCCQRDCRSTESVGPRSIRRWWIWSWSRASSARGVDGEKQGASFLIVDVEHLDLHLHVAAEMAVDQLELAVGELVDQEAAGEADPAVEGVEGGALASG